MGVIGAFCRLCRLPLNHDHYVPALGGHGMLKIYRTGSAGGDHDWEPGERVVVLGPEHAWLCDAVAVSYLEDGRVHAGTLEDGALVEHETGNRVFVFDGDEDAVTFHRYCHEQMGAPTRIADLVRGHGTFEWAVLELHGGQLFELALLVDQDKGWVLVDPRGTSPEALRSRARIAGLLAEARRPIAGPPTRIADVLVADRDWTGLTLFDDTHVARNIVLYRRLEPALDRAGYDELLWVMKEYDGSKEYLPGPDVLTELEAFLRATKIAVEAERAAILALATIGDGQMQMLIYARNEPATRAVIDAVPGGALTRPVEYDNEADPTWRCFAQMDPRSHGR